MEYDKQAQKNTCAANTITQGSGTKDLRYTIHYNLVYAAVEVASCAEVTGEARLFSSWRVGRRTT